MKSETLFLLFTDYHQSPCYAKVHEYYLMTNYLYISLQHFWDLDSPECQSHCNCSWVGDPPYQCILFYPEVWGSFRGWKVQLLQLSKDTYIPYTI